MDNQKTISMKVADLEFDRKNPRLVEFDDLTNNSTESDVIRVLWEAMDVKELVLSIAASGFFSHEPLIVTKEDEKNIVIEGNRRLAAVRLLLHPALVEDLQHHIPGITDEAQENLQEIPTLYGTREDTWRYLGFKHVNGPAKWSSYAKSQYIADVHRKFAVTLEDIAKQIGDTHKTVQRLFRGLMVIEQAEKLRVFDRENRWRRHFSFSHLYTGLQYDGISTFIGLKQDIGENPNPVPVEKKQELRDLCRWLYGSKIDGISPVIQSQNPHLRQLDAVLGSKEATAALRNSQDLAYAFEVSRPPTNVFTDSLIASKQNLQKARAMLSTGYDGSEELLRVAGTIATLADDLYEEMDRKSNPGKKKRITEDV